MDDRKNCSMRHKNGNCLPCGGFCTAINDPTCEALQNAYESGFRNGMMVQRWIPASEPPKQTGEYLVYAGERGYRTLMIRYYDTLWRDWYKWKYTYERDHTVTHWMPLPKLPTGE